FSRNSNFSPPPVAFSTQKRAFRKSFNNCRDCHAPVAYPSTELRSSSSRSDTGSTPAENAVLSAPVRLRIKSVPAASRRTPFDSHVSTEGPLLFEESAAAGGGAVGVDSRASRLSFRYPGRHVTDRERLFRHASGPRHCSAAPADVPDSRRPRRSAVERMLHHSCASARGSLV
ncbi:hypothetical protein TYRP_023296, partial [Tyrophagus putrescentiae]